MTRAHQPCLNSASSQSRCICVGILRAVGHEGRNSRLSHYHETSGLAQTHEELVHTTRYIYEILHCHTKTRVPHCKVLAPNIQILNNHCPISSEIMHQSRGLDSLSTSCYGPSIDWIGWLNPSQQCYWPVLLGAIGPACQFWCGISLDCLKCYTQLI